MVLDFIYRLSRRCLPGSFYAFLRNSPFGRAPGYDRLITYRAGVQYFLNNGLIPDKKVILEIGCGNQFYSAFELISHGAQKVILCDPALDTGKLPNQLAVFNSATGSNLGLESVSQRIHAYSDISAIPSNWNNQVDAILSHYVLEHINDVDSIFKTSWKLLKQNGLSIHLVDLGDHIYQLFGHFPFLRNLSKYYAQNHMRWSSRMFAMLNDPKCSMARHTMPEIVASARVAGFSTETTNINHNRIPAKIHPSFLKDCPKENVSDLDVLQFTLVLTKA